MKHNLFPGQEIPTPIFKSFTIPDYEDFLVYEYFVLHATLFGETIGMKVRTGRYGRSPQPNYLYMRAKLTRQLNLKVNEAQQ